MHTCYRSMTAVMEGYDKAYCYRLHVAGFRFNTLFTCPETGNCNLKPEASNYTTIGAAKHASGILNDSTNGTASCLTSHTSLLISLRIALVFTPSM